MKQWCCLLLMACCAVGCSRSTPVPPAKNADNPAVTTDAALKERLTFISEVGGMGSAFSGIVEMAEKKGDAALIADAKELSKSQSPAKAKVIAKKMLEKLK